MTMQNTVQNNTLAGEPASLRRRRERRGLRYWLSPRYDSRKARLAALEKVVGYLLDADGQDAMALAANGIAGNSIQRHREASGLRVIKGGAL